MDGWMDGWMGSGSGRDRDSDRSGLVPGCVCHTSSHSTSSSSRNRIPCLIRNSRITYGVVIVFNLETIPELPMEW